MVWTGRELKDHLIPNPSAMGRDTFHQTRLLRALSNLALNTSRERAATDSLVNLFLCLMCRQRSLMLKEKKKGRDQQLSPWGRRTGMTLSCLPAQCPGSVCCRADEISYVCVCIWQGLQSPLIIPGWGSDILLPVHYDKQILNLLFPDLF